MTSFPYPTTRREDVVEKLHGTDVADPYRWLEDDHSPETEAWVRAQNEVTFAYLESIPERAALRERLTGLWDYEKFGIPFQRGGRYFYTRNDGLQNQSVLYWADALADAPRVLLDPNGLSADGTVALSTFAVSDDGQYLAYGLSEAGSDWVEIRVRRVEGCEDLPDRVQWVKFSSPTWASGLAAPAGVPGGEGFYYSRYDAPPAGEDLKNANYYQKLAFHRLGTEQSEDELVYQRPDQKEWGFEAQVSDDHAYLVIPVWKGTYEENGLFYRDLGLAGSPVVELLRDFDASYVFLGNDGARFYLLTNHSAPLRRIVAVDLARPAPQDWTTLIPEGSDALESASLVGDRLICAYLHDAHSQVKVFDLGGGPLAAVDLPGLGSAWGFEGRRADRETFYYFTSFTTPGDVYRFDLERLASERIFHSHLPFDPEGFVTEQVFFASKDGARVPMFISYARGLRKDGRNRTYLYGYGGFNISISPVFNPTMLAWMEMGGVFASANLRGGGEYGQAWHAAGMKANKQNVFDDFVAAAGFLIASGYTSTPRLAIHGGSNGGLLAGACLTQHPDMFGAVVVSVGVLDMLRFHKFTIGWAWVSDYGSPDDPADFPNLLAYSPYHNIRAGAAYPPTLITTGDHDDRVFPAHSFKFAAALQHAQHAQAGSAPCTPVRVVSSPALRPPAGEPQGGSASSPPQGGSAPLLIRIDVRAGHGAGKPTSKSIEERADILAFLVKNLG